MSNLLTEGLRLFFGREGIIAENDPEEQEKIIK
jgi:hypothetical protein